MEELKDLRDIHGLGPIDHWPLAFGWWILIALGVILVAVIIVLSYRRYRYRRSWQHQAYQQLIVLQQQLDNDAQKRDVLQALAVALRKIAIASTRREDCAGLTGNAWLAWLQQHDPKNFAWQEYGQILIHARYQPDIATDQQSIVRLITATKKWVEKC